ncbi:surface-adhesin E family protein [Pseudorhodoferax sp.]|uniref:surface-adhesin E family protein n=1 Tax=Pseudorhodoferax sp. TaxID=1993553 RepID=UPI002DD66AFB|nr:surface-adhesin E family protein [Pseudorhodoferax sp.]
MLPLLLAQLPALAAEWTELPQPASAGVAVYQEPATEQFRHNPLVGLFVRNPRQSWFLTDYAVPHRWMLYEVRSVKQWLEFDCKRAGVRMLARLYYDGPMAQGRLVAAETEAPGFSPVVPGHPEEAMYHAACAYEQPQQADAGGQAAAGP